MITIRQGKTLTLELEVVDKDMKDLDLAGATAYMAYTTGTETIQTVAGTIVENVVSVSMSSLETSTLDVGDYEIEVKIKDADGNVDDIYADRLKVLKSIMPTYPTQ